MNQHSNHNVTRGVLFLLAAILLFSLTSAHAAIAIRGSSSNGVATGNLSIPMPAGTVANDVMIATIAVRPRTITITPPSGWIQIESLQSSNIGNTSMRMATYYKPAVTSEFGPYIFTMNGTNTGVVGGIVSFSGVDTLTPIDASSGNPTPNGFTHTANGITTTIADVMLVTSHAFTSATSNWTPPVGMTEAVDITSIPRPDTVGMSLEMNFQLLTTAGVTGQRSATAAAAGTDAGYGVAHILSLRPSSGIPPVIPSCQTFRDEFSTESYNLNDGTLSWATDWIETGDNGNPSNGDIEISGGRLQLEGDGLGGTVTFGGPSIEREANLFGFATAILTFDFSETGNLESTDTFDIWVSSNGGTSWTKIHSYTDDQPGTLPPFSADITPYISNNTRIAFVERADASNETFLVDNVQIEACTGTVPDHLRILHDGNGLTCAPEIVTIQACADTACTSLYTGAITVDLTSPVAGWSLDPVTIIGGTASLDLRVTAASTISLAAAATSPTAINPTRCFIGTTESCAMTFYDSGFIFDVPDHTADTTQNIIMSAVRKDLTSEQCVPGFQNVSKDVNFWSENLDPASGTLLVNINGTNIATTSPGSTLGLNFDSNGQTTLQLRYPDAGLMGLNAQYIGSGSEAGLVMSGVDSFVSKPAWFILTIPGNPVAVDANGAVFKRAGENFFINVAAQNASGALTPNYGRESVPESVGLITTLVAPVGGINPSLVGSFNSFGQDCAGNPSAAGTACGSFAWPEVGIITVTPQVADGNYFAAGNVTGTTSSNVGRFIPASFAINHTNSPTCSGAFTYAGLAGPPRVGQPFGVTGTVTALNLAGIKTENYAGSYAKLVPANISATPREGGAAANGNLSWSVDSLSFPSGFFADNGAQYAFNAEGTPQNMNLRITATDSDGVTGTEDDVSKSVEYRFGRLRLQNAIGPEIMPLTMPFMTEYLSAVGYVTNVADGCTAPALATNLQLSNPLTAGGTWQAGDTAMLIGGATTSASLLNSPFLGGIGDLSFSAPGTGNTGYVDVRTQIAASFPWLLYDWDGDGAFDNEATGRASFGLYQGSGRQIYLRERY